MEETFEDLVASIKVLLKLNISEEAIYEFLDEESNWSPDSLHEAFNQAEEEEMKTADDKMDLFRL